MKIRKQPMRLVLGLCLLVAAGLGQGSNAKAPAGAAVRVTGLKTEAASEALGIDNPKPRFTWRLEASRPSSRRRTASCHYPAESCRGATIPRFGCGYAVLCLWLRFGVLGHRALPGFLLQRRLGLRDFL